MEIYNDDCFNIFDKIDKKSIDLVIVDLPYGQTACEWDKKIDMTKMWIELKKICKKNCIYCFFTTTKFGYELINSNPRWFRYDLVWEKTNSVGFLSANKMPLRLHEMIYVFSNPGGGKKTYNPQKTYGHKLIQPVLYPANKCKSYSNYSATTYKNTDGSRHPTSVMKINSDYRNKGIHPTQKPVELCKWLINSYSNENDTVLDFTMGSGSTGIACKNTNRKFIGIEKEEKFFNIAKERLDCY